MPGIALQSEPLRPVLGGRGITKAIQSGIARRSLLSVATRESKPFFWSRWPFWIHMMG